MLFNRVALNLARLLHCLAEFTQAPPACSHSGNPPFHGEYPMNSMLKAAAVLVATVVAAPAMAQTKVSIGISGWTASRR